MAQSLTASQIKNIHGEDFGTILCVNSWGEVLTDLSDSKKYRVKRTRKGGADFRPYSNTESFTVQFLDY